MSFGEEPSARETMEGEEARGSLSRGGANVGVRNKGRTWEWVGSQAKSGKSCSRTKNSEGEVTKQG